ncbi:glycoside hydrolase [Sinomonas humi]|uniref:Glycoside hydrolase n=1 Tax=Sinomonas humi TaxID=1338436 RepID=A0A0B2ADD2_9MICC|nr:glycoside hydrolase [Sinomonas humi]
MGNPPGWKQVFADDFTEGNVPLGSFPGSFSAKWSANYFDATPDTAGQKNGGRSGYYPSKVLSIHNGMMDMYLHSQNGVSMGAAPAPKINGDSQRPYNSQTYGMYSVRFRSDALPGFKTAWLLWPDSGIWPQDGEIDYPEQDLSSKFFAALHSAGSTQELPSAVFQSDASFQTWNTATIEWTPGRVEFFLNGKSIGASTSGVPDLPMHYLLQTESCLPTCPDPKTQGHLYVDWVAIWALG